MRFTIAIGIIALLLTLVSACGEGAAGPGVIVPAECEATYTRTVTYDSGIVVETVDYVAPAAIDSTAEAFPIVQVLLCSRETFDEACPLDADCTGRGQTPSCELVSSVPFVSASSIEVPCGQVVETTLPGSPLVRRSGYRWREVSVTMRD
jgi:hypothetical protein